MKESVDSAQEVVLRDALVPEDRAAIQTILQSTGFFNPAEISIALELIDDGLDRQEDSEYRFMVAEASGHVVGYSCLGPVACTVSSWDLYWIAVSPGTQGSGIGRRLVLASEELARRHGATRMYIDTAGREQYVPTRAFYERCGYGVAATFTDFYAPGDAKVVFLKVL